MYVAYNWEQRQLAPMLRHSDDGQGYCNYSC